MHANLIFLFKPTLDSSTLVIKLFESSIKLFIAEILTVTIDCIDSITGVYTIYAVTL